MILLGTHIKTNSETFEILEELGRGGMAIVYKAYQPLLNRTVALKLFNKDTTSEAQLQRFAREAKLAAQLDHPNIVKVFAFDCNDSQPFIVMEYVEGKTLSTLVKERGALTDEEMPTIFLPIVSALSYMHQSGLVHRDIKPSNIIVTADGATKLMDLGIAKDIGGTKEEQKLTSTGMLCGSPSYMSPEQCNGQPLDARSDIYSLGCAMYEAATGRVPYVGETPLEVMFHHLHSDTPVANNSSLAPIIARAMQKDRADRFQSAEQFRDAIEKNTGGLKITPPRRKSKTKLIIPIAAICAVMAAASVYAIYPSMPPEKIDDLVIVKKYESLLVNAESSKPPTGLTSAQALEVIHDLRQIEDSTFDLMSKQETGRRRSDLYKVLGSAYWYASRWRESKEAWLRCAEYTDAGMPREIDHQNRYRDCLEALAQLQAPDVIQQILPSFERYPLGPSDKAFVSYVKVYAGYDSKRAPNEEILKQARNAVAQFDAIEPDVLGTNHLRAERFLGLVLARMNRHEEAAKVLSAALDRSEVQPKCETSARHITWLVQRRNLACLADEIARTLGDAKLRRQSFTVLDQLNRDLGYVK